MSAAAIIAIAIGVVVILAAISFVTLARKSDVRGAGALSGETRTPRPLRPRGPARPRPSSRRRRPAREVEAQGAVARYGTTIVPAREVAPIPWSPPDPEALGVSRRQFFNRATVTLTSAGVGAFFAAGFVAFLWPTASGGFGQPVTVGKLDDILESIRTGDGFFYAPRRPDVDHRVPRRRAAQGHAPSTPTTSSPAWSRASSPSTRSARTSAAASRRAPRASGSSARATARSTTRSARRRPARRRGAWTASRSPSSGSGDVTVDTGTDRPRPADRHQHHRPGGRGPALHHRRRRALMIVPATQAAAGPRWRSLALGS